MITSEKGYDWSGNPLNSETLKGGVAVLWRGKEFTTGNRRFDLVELCDASGNFIRTVNAEYVALIAKGKKLKKHLKKLA